MNWKYVLLPAYTLITDNSTIIPTYVLSNGYPTFEVDCKDWLKFNNTYGKIMSQKKEI